VALQDIDLEIAANESVCVLGPSGCGKTTLLRIVDSLIGRDRGDVLIDEEPVSRPRPDVAVVFQHFGLFPWKRLDENIAYGLELRGKPRDDIAAIVERYVTLIGLKGFEKSYPHQLSGGMQQRAGLARAMAINPSVLLMAEPYSFPADLFLRQLNEQQPGLEVVGGMASGSGGPGMNRLFCDDESLPSGAVGAILRGVTMKAVVSQGCRPAGPA